MRAEIAVFARAPRPGRTKTRLIPALGPEGAAALYAAFLEDTLTKLEGLDARLWAASEADAPALEGRGWPVSAQVGGDLGARMSHAIADGLGRADGVIVIGTDAPTLPPARLRDAIDALRTHDAVLGPSADGGYYLIGSRAPVSFGAVRWSTRHALADTLAGLGSPARLLRPWYDVDTPDDLALLRAHLALRSRDAPATSRALSRHFDHSAADG